MSQSFSGALSTAIASFSPESRAFSLVVMGYVSSSVTCSYSSALFAPGMGSFSFLMMDFPSCSVQIAYISIIGTLHSVRTYRVTVLLGNNLPLT